MFYYLTKVSRNSKTGPIPVSTSSRRTCPPSCPLLRNGCYAEGGPIRIHWDQISSGERGMPFEEFLQEIRKLPRNQLWRYGQAGDLPGEGDAIDREALAELARANRSRPVIAFTHKPPTSYNMGALREARTLGFQVNLSADDLKEADDLADTGFPVVVVLPPEMGRKTVRGKWAETLSEYRSRLKGHRLETPKGRKIAVCPAQYTDTQCSDCRVCSHSRKGVIIGFPAHGNKRNKIGKMDTS